MSNAEHEPTESADRAHPAAIPGEGPHATPASDISNGVARKTHISVHL